MPENIVEVSHLKKRFSGGKDALRDVTFSLPYGCIMGYVGENGAGKTTTLRCLLRAQNADEGEIRLFGTPLADLACTDWEKVGAVYDESSFAPYLTPRCLAGILRGLYRRWDDRCFEALLARFRLPDGQKIGTFSKGMQTKLNLSAALAHHPQLLVLDEVTGGLDPVAREEILDLFLEFVQQDDRAILFSTHITSDLEKVADQITFLLDGTTRLTVDRDTLMDRYGIVRCLTSQTDRLPPLPALAVRRLAQRTDFLVADRAQAQQLCPGMVVDRPTVEEVLILLSRQETTGGAVL